VAGVGGAVTTPRDGSRVGALTGGGATGGDLGGASGETGEQDDDREGYLARAYGGGAERVSRSPALFVHAASERVRQAASDLPAARALV
jgi:hypothetical protein